MGDSCRHVLHHDKALGHPVCCSFAVCEEQFSQQLGEAAKPCVPSICPCGSFSESFWGL